MTQKVQGATYSKKDLMVIINHFRMVAKGEIKEELSQGLELIVKEVCT
jgi:hypothetical protein